MIRLLALVGALGALAGCLAAPDNRVVQVPSPDVNARLATAPAPPDAPFRDDLDDLVINFGYAQPQPFFIVFYTDYCGTCQAMRPHLHALEAEYWSRVIFLYMDANNPANIEAVERLEIRETPVFVLLYFYDNVLQRWDGAPSMDDFRAAFETHVTE